ncbi:MAG TPA: ABC-F family ATP-binding cassette domain-containing protein [Paludibacteraceae bacterium]|nr:ABC-F family ATP-binding cassette domain-containing protein [Paludibacteraceae bacterium]HPH63142.1 ABC-F family ATP-binding cassette domain-containing protein [Paludibacteraceae bacterium]
MAANYLQVENLTKSFGDKLLFENISFSIFEGQRIALIAKNGSGKTTLLNIIAGNEQYDGGNITFKRDLRVSILPQDPQYPAGLTVLQACFQSDNEIVKTIEQYEEALLNPSDEEKFNKLLTQMENYKAWEYETRIKQILGKLKIYNFDQKVENLSGGQLKRVALANVLITEPEMLILDEPTNHLDLEMVEWLEDFLKKSKMALLMVTHDRYFLDRVCSDILEIDQQQLFSYKGNYSYYLEKRQERIDIQNAELTKANNLFRKELDWMRRQPQARAGKAQYRIDSFYDLEKKVKAKRDKGEVSLDVKASYIGSKIFEAKYISKKFGDLKILDNFYYNFARFEKLGIVGNNGTGKSTFIKMLVGEEKPDNGTIDVGETVRFGYYSQNGLKFEDQMKVIDVVKSIAEEVSLGDGRKMNVSQFLQYFLFTPETQHNYVYKISGGERRRLYLCTVLMQNPNFLVLDEPTNDLDIVTLNVLEDYLQSFKGCVIVVSHDRYFMDKVVDHLLVFHGNAEIQDFPGNYSDFREWKEAKSILDKQEKSAIQNKDKKEEKAPQQQRNSADRPRKMTFKEKKEFEDLEKDIAALETEKKVIEEGLSNGTIQGDELIEKSQRIGVIIDELDEKTMRWLELSEIG